MKEKKIYEVLSLLLMILAIVIFSVIDIKDNIVLSTAIRAILILYLCKVVYGCLLYIKRQYEKRKYSYSIIMNLGLVIFLVINILRQINLLIVNFGTDDIKSIYANTLYSFSYFAVLTVPFIIFLSIYGVISNVFLIRREGIKFTNLLGVIFGITNIISIIAGQIVYMITSSLLLSKLHVFLKVFVDISLNTLISYWYCLILATLFCNIVAANHKSKYDKDFIIILGSKVNQDGSLTPLLTARVNKAIDFANEQKEVSNKKIIFIPSGGKGDDESITEALAIKNYLISNGIDEKDIIIEDKSTNTTENMKYSKEKIDTFNKDGKIVFSTTNYHVFRSGVIANNEGIDCEGIGSSSKWYFYTNALIREFVANLVSQKWQHLILISIINIVLFILVLIGYIYNLL